MPTLAELRAQRLRGLDPVEQNAVRLQTVADAAADAFAAASLEEAQAAIGGSLPALVTTITLDAPFDSPSGAAPQTTATRTFTVAAGNPGGVIVRGQTVSGSPTITYSLDGTGPTPLTLDDDVTITAADADTLDFTGSTAGAASILLLDATTGAVVNPAFTITAS